MKNKLKKMNALVDFFSKLPTVDEVDRRSLSLRRLWNKKAKATGDCDCSKDCSDCSPQSCGP
ncbi:MAG: hypothetical protein M1514_03180 [Patescibacteria group bacterium]|nr:hypothetical protein [Patescibacteria group bacterium]